MLFLRYQNNDNKIGSNNEYITGLYKIDEDDILAVTNKYSVLLNINNGVFNQELRPVLFNTKYIKIISYINNFFLCR